MASRLLQRTARAHQPMRGCGAPGRQLRPSTALLVNSPHTSHSIAHVKISCLDMARKWLARAPTGPWLRLRTCRVQTAATVRQPSQGTHGGPQAVDVTASGAVFVLSADLAVDGTVAVTPLPCVVPSTASIPSSLSHRSSRTSHLFIFFMFNCRQ